MDHYPETLAADDALSRIVARHKAQKRLWDQLRPMDVDTFARKALDDVARNRALIVYPAWWRVLRLLNGVAPSLMDALGRRQLEKIRALRAR